MEIRQLEYFLMVAEELNFSRAAERLHMTQPPLSAQIKALEDEIGATLFVRSTRKVRLTEVGELFRESSARLLSQLRDDVAQARRAGAGEIGQLTVGFVPSATIEALPPILRAFRDRYPKVSLRLDELNPGQQVQALLAGTLDCGLFYLPPGDEPPFDEPSLKSTGLSREQLVAALPQGHALATRRRVPVSALVDEPFVTISGHRGRGLRDAIRDQCRLGGIEPKVVQEAALIQTIAGLVASGLGVALLPASVRRVQPVGVVYRPLEGPSVEVRMGLVWPRHATSRVLQGFVETARGQGEASWGPA